MIMHNPVHPGEFIQATYIKPFHLSCRYLAQRLGVSSSTLSRLLNKKTSVSPEMALRLSKVFSRTAESWLSMQYSYDLWHVKKKVKLGKIKPLKLKAA